MLKQFMTRFFVKWLKIVVIGLWLSPLSAMAYTYDEIFPNFSATFIPLVPGGTVNLYGFTKNPATGIGSGFNFPTTWQTLSIGQDIRIRILVPPGTDYGTVGLEAPSMAAHIGICEGLITSCTLSQGRASMGLPLQLAVGASLSEPKILSLVVSAIGYPFTFNTMSLVFHIGDPVKYENWRSQRSWAGGKGDCDGMGNVYCATTTFAITPSSQQLAASGILTLTATNGAISSCTSSNIAVIPNPTVATGGASASAPASSAGQATITCISTTGASASSGVITIIPPQPGTFSITASSQQIVAGGTLILTPSNGSTISSCTSDNTAAIPNPTVAKDGTSASAPASSAGKAAITCTSATGASASSGVITITPPPTPSAFSLTQSSQTVKPGGSFTLSALTGAISYCHSDSIGAIPDLTVAADHTTATGKASLTALPDNSVKITCFSTKTPSDIATAFVTVIPASTAFTLTPITLKNIFSTSVTISTTASDAMTGYWVALPLGAVEPAPPMTSEITSGTFSATSGGKSGNKELLAGKPTDIELSGLAANTNYRVYFYAAPSGTTGIYQQFNIATILPTPESILGDTKDSKNSALKLDVTITPASNHTGQGKYYVAAYIPSGTELFPSGGLFFFTQKGWAAWTGGNWLEYSQEALTTKIIPVVDGLDVTKLLKTSIYGAYETDAGVKISKEVYTVQPTTSTTTKAM